MDGNLNANNNTIPNIVNEFEAMSQNGGLNLLHEKDFIELILYFEKELMLDKALEITDLALERFSYIPDLFLKKAQILIALNNTSEAFEALDQALMLAPAENEAKLMKANCLIMDKAYDDAFSMLSDIMVSGSYKERLSASLLKANIHEILKDYNQMFTHIKFVLDLEPGNEPAMEKLWSYMEAQRSYHQGINYLNQLLNNEPYAYLAWYNLGQAYSCIGEYENAIAAYEYSFIIQPSFELGYKDCADLAFQLCKYKFALKVYSDALENLGPDSEVFACIGECYLKLKQYRLARLNFRKSNRLDPYNDEVHYNLGICFAAEHKYEIALQHYFKALKIEDCREEYFAAAAEAFYKIGEVDKANYYFIKATEIGGDIPEIWFAHAKFLYEIEEYQKSLEILEEADEYTYSAELLYIKVLTLVALDRKDEASEILKEALSEDYETHRILFQINPNLKDDAEMTSIINYFQPED